MFGYIISRLLQAIPILILVSLIAFGIIYLIPGDAAVVIGGPSATPEELAQIRQNLGLDQPLHIQILTFYAHLFQGDLGRSLTLGIPVVDALLAKPAEAMRQTQALLRREDTSAILERMDLENGHFAERLASDEVKQVIAAFFAARAAKA